MITPPERVRLSEQGKYRLIRLKAITGITQWNTLARWALCHSLADTSTPLIRDVRTDSNVEMDWKTFGGVYADLYLALLVHRCHADGIQAPSTQDVAHTLTVHLHRGIGYLIAARHTSVTEFIATALNTTAPRTGGQER